jgi:adenylate cyclase
VEIVRGWLGVGEGAEPAVVRMKSRARLGAVTGESAEHLMPLFDRLLGVSAHTPDGAGMAGAPAWSHIEEAVVTWLELLASEQPIVVVLEDVQWADTSTISLSRRLLDLTERAAVSVILTLRLDDATPGSDLRLSALGDHPHRARSIELAPLDDDAARFLAAALSPAGIGAPLASRIVGLAQGNPRFLEELISFATSAEELGRRRTWTVSVQQGSLLPTSIENVLVARIDALPDGTRQVAQAAAVIGPRLRHDLLKELTGGDELDHHLTALLRGQILTEVAGWPAREYAFRHRLMHEATLASVSAARREDLYTRLAPIAERAYGTTHPEHLEMLAHYYARSRDPARALSLLEDAADRAAALGGHDHAAELRDRASRMAVRIDASGK